MREMRIGLLGFREEHPNDALRKCIDTMRAVTPDDCWRFGQMTWNPDGTDLDLLRSELCKRTVDVLEPGDRLISFSATPKAEVPYKLVSFELYNRRDVSAVRLCMEFDGRFRQRLSECSELMMHLVGIWEPESAYATSFAHVNQICPSLSGVFPSGYMIYRNQPINTVENGADFETLEWQTGCCIKLGESFTDEADVTCEHLTNLLSLAGGSDERFRVIV